MAKERRISKFKRRKAVSFEALLTSNNLRILRGDDWRKIPAVAICCHSKPVDAILIVGDNLRAGAEAAEFLHFHKAKFGFYPDVVCSKGLSTPLLIEHRVHSVVHLKRILAKMGIPAPVVNMHNLPENVLPIDAIVGFFGAKTNASLRRVAVFSSNGYSLNVAQELYFRLPSMNWFIYDNPFVPEDKRIFESEIIGPDGYAIDLMMVNLLRAQQDWGDKRCALPDELVKRWPKNEELKKFVLKGYVLGFENLENGSILGIDKEQLLSLFSERDCEFVLLKEDAYVHISHQINMLIKQYETGEMNNDF